MSLLMDALKKAEQEKREAAKRLEEASERTLIADLNAPAAAETTGEMEVTPAPESDSGSARIPEDSGLSLEPLGGARPPMPDLDVPAPLEVDLEPTLEIESVSPASPPPPPVAPPPPPEPVNPDATFHGIGVERELPGMYEPTVQGEPLEMGESYDETLPGVSAAQLARDIGPADQPTPAAAETVFAAARGPRGPSPALKWTMIGLTVLAVLAAGVGYYVTVTPMTPELPSPWVARGIEASPPVATPAGMPPPVAGVLPEVPVEEIPAAQVVPAPGDTMPVPAEPVPEPAAPAVVEATEPPVLPVDETAAAPAQAVEPSRTPAPPQAADSGQGEAPIRISRTRAVPEASRLLREAWSHFQAGDLDSARMHYLAVLEDQPENLDALMGMGAIAMKERDEARVAEYFSRVLKLDPRNELATAALIGLRRGGDPVNMESALKNLLHGRPDSAYLHFSLGNIYAAQRRWPEAQQAFFDAYRNDSSNPDYALNLAASLDRMGQREAALDYYRVALKLAEERTASFDPAPVQRRIETLSALDP